MEWVQPLTPRLPLPGKVIPILNAGALRAVALVTTEEHIRHVLLALHVTAQAEGRPIPPLLRRATLYHDYRKKIGVDWRFWRCLESHPGHLRRTQQQLTMDFQATLDRENAAAEAVEISRLRSADVATAYLAFAQRETSYYFTTDRLFEFPPKLPRPFGNHADEFRPSDFPDADDQWREEAADLVRLHHAFQADHLIAACARWGGTFARHLYRLMAADHLGSRWAETAILAAEEDDRAQPPAVQGETDRPRWTDFGEWHVETGIVNRQPAADECIATMELALSRHGDAVVTVPFQVLYSVREVQRDD